MTKDGSGLPLLIAHRGASHDAPENTLAAFHLAWQQGADGLEGDFRMTRDGRIVCVHDETMARTAGVDLCVAETELAELKKLDVGRQKGEKWAGERIPTLEQVLDTVPRHRSMFVDLKCGPEALPAIERAVARCSTQPEQVVVMSFDRRVVIETRERIPHVRAYWLVRYRWDEPTGEWLPSLAEIIETLDEVGAHGLGVIANCEAEGEQLAGALRQAGREFNVWMIDKLETARYFQALGVDSITTSRPAFLRDGLTGRH